MQKWIDLLCEITPNTKYRKWYINICTKQNLNSTITENHHIVPKSFGLDNINDITNLVSLTPKEHYIVHRLLIKMKLPPPLHKKMVYAMWRMINPQSKKHDRPTRQTSMVYSSVRTKIATYMQTNNPMKDPDVISRRTGVTRPDQSGVCKRRNEIYWKDETSRKKKRERDIQKQKDLGVGFELIDTQTNERHFYWIISDILKTHNLKRSVVNSLYTGVPYMGRYIIQRKKKRG